MRRLPRWLIARRLVQLTVLGGFWAGAHLGAARWLRGDLSSATVAGWLPLTDPFAALQMWLAGHAVAATALTGAAVVLGLYGLVGGRGFCGWVCPINPVTDLAAWINRRFALRGAVRLSRQARWVTLAVSLALSAALGVAVFEWISPIGVAQRWVIYGLGGGWTVVAGVLLFDLFIVERGVCGHLCPLGAFYQVVGARPAVRVRFDVTACDDCMACHKICPERHVLRPILPGAVRATWINSGACLNCGRCVDACEPGALALSLRWPLRAPRPTPKPPTQIPPPRRTT